MIPEHPRRARRRRAARRPPNLVRVAQAQLSNTAIADAFDELGDLYELDGAIVHRVLAYRSAAKAVRNSSVSVAALAREGRATELPGIGNTLQEKILTLLQTGSIPSAERLRAKFPPGLIAITQLPGLGPKRARLLHSELGIDSLDRLNILFDLESEFDIESDDEEAKKVQNIPQMIAGIEHLVDAKASGRES